MEVPIFRGPLSWGISSNLIVCWCCLPLQAGSTFLLTIHGVLADLADTSESVVFEQLDRPAAEEAALGLAAEGDFVDGLDQAAVGLGDLVEGTLQGCLGAVSPVDVGAGDPPSGSGGASLSYARRCLMLDSSSGLPYWHQPWAAPSSSRTSAA